MLMIIIKINPHPLLLVVRTERCLVDVWYDDLLVIIISEMLLMSQKEKSWVWCLLPTTKIVALALSEVVFSCGRRWNISSKQREVELTFCLSFRNAFPVCQVARNLHLPAFTMPVSSHNGGESLFFFHRKPGEQWCPKQGGSFHFCPVIMTWV